MRGRATRRGPTGARRARARRRRRDRRDGLDAGRIERVAAAVRDRSSTRSSRSGLVAVVAGGVLLVYGLTQRKAIAREIASGRYRRTSLVDASSSSSALFTALVVLAAQELDAGREPPDEEGELRFPGATPDPRLRTTSRSTPYEPSVSWLPIAVVVGLVVVAVVAYVVAERRARRARRSERDARRAARASCSTTRSTTSAPRPTRGARSSPRTPASSACSPRTASARHASETSDEYLARVLRDLELDAGRGRPPDGALHERLSSRSTTSTPR